MSVDTSAIQGIPIIWVMGGPGSGKGTQCDRICVRYGYTHMSSGDLLRNEVMSMTERGRKIYQLMSNGEQVPNSEVDQLLVEAMTSKKSTKGFLIDGFPLDDEQAEAFVSDIGQPTAVIHLEANDTILIERLKSRNNFDDTEDAIKKRVENYNAKTKPVAQKFNAKVINAERAADDIFADIQKVMDAM